MKILKLTLLLICLPIILLAQEGKVLKPSAAGFSLDFLGKDKVEKVSIGYEGDTDLTVEVKYKGFDSNDYEITGEIQNRAKKRMKGTTIVKKLLPKGGNSLELHFDFQDDTNDRMEVESYFLFLTFTAKKEEKSDIFDGLFDSPTGNSAFGTKKYLYEYRKKWRVDGNSSITVNVVLTPYKTAASIIK